MNDSADTAIAEPSTIAVEMTRRQALQAMGIEVYVSRFDLPGAAPAIRQRFTPVATPGPEPLANAASAPHASNPDQSSTAAGRASQNSEQTPSQTSAGVKPVTHASDGVEFSVLLASAGPFLWVEQLPDGLIRQDQLALINAMARAISSEVSIRQQQFDWPMRSNTALGTDMESAKQALQGFIKRTAREVNAKRVVVMGHCPYLPDRIAQSAVIIPATLAMLQNAALKREAWKALKPLRATEFA